MQAVQGAEVLGATQPPLEPPLPEELEPDDEPELEPDDPELDPEEPEDPHAPELDPDDPELEPDDEPELDPVLDPQDEPELEPEDPPELDPEDDPELDPELDEEPPSSPVGSKKGSCGPPLAQPMVNRTGARRARRERARMTRLTCSPPATPQLRLCDVLRHIQPGCTVPPTCVSVQRASSSGSARA